MYKPSSEKVILPKIQRTHRPFIRNLDYKFCFVLKKSNSINWTGYRKIIHNVHIDVRQLSRGLSIGFQVVAEKDEKCRVNFLIITPRIHTT